MTNWRQILSWQVELVLDAREAIPNTPPPKGYNRYTGYVQYPDGSVEEIDADARNSMVAKKQVVEILKRDYEPGFLEPIRVIQRQGWYL